MQAMTDNIRLPDELGQQLQARRKALGMSKSALADRAGKVREVIYRLEAGEESTVSSLFAVMGAMGLLMRVEHVGLPTATEVAARVMEEGDDSWKKRLVHSYVGPAWKPKVLGTEMG